ncbi:MAG: RAMP superfamily CRISPR-associated protein [Prevotella sp.]|nr:RAMP superfamily CRISPR-associated protein [Prevotella sp.]
MEDKKYHIELEVLTPLSAGAGNDNEWTKGIDFVQKDLKVYVIDIKKAAKEGVDIDQLTTLFLKSDDKGICLLLGDKIEKVSRLVFDSPVNTNNSIKSFIRTQLYDKPLIPGSSIKGSLRSALFNYLRDNEKENAAVFGDMKAGTDFMRFIRVSDVEMPSTVLVNTKIFNLHGKGNDWQGGWKHKGTDREGNSHTDSKYSSTGFNTLYECVAPGKKGYGNISLASGAYQLLEKENAAAISHKEKKSQLIYGSLNDMFSVINRVTKGYLEKEREFFEKYTAERSEEILENINYLLSQIPADGSCCLLKMSAGVGFHSITGDWQYEDYDDTGFYNSIQDRNYGKKRYKSRKTAEYNGSIQLMGFVKIRITDEEESKAWEEKMQKEHHDCVEQILLPIKKKEEEKEKRIAEERQRQEARREEEHKKEIYSELLASARRLYASENWEEALSNAQKAADIYPANKEVAELIDRIKRDKASVEYKIQEQAAATQRFSQPLAEVIKGKMSVGNILGTTAKWLKSEGHSLGEEEYAALLQGLSSLPQKELKKVKRKDFIKSIGEVHASRILKELGME